MRSNLLFLVPALLLIALACDWHRPDNANAALTKTATAQAARVDSVRPTSASASLTDADFANHVTALKNRIKTKLQSNQFSIVIQKPFVVVGDEPEETVRQRAGDTVKWAVDKLKQDFFTMDPDLILEIWLFKNDASYRRNTRLMFGDSPSTPYGYYSRRHKALIMNIETGGGTLVHEIVHPFIEANFPACPSWLNEGLGSLYEQCGEVDGHIRGYTNWRLPGLQLAIRENRVPSFQTLMEMDTKAFYSDDRGVHYAPARYLCYYLQQRGLLVKFYQEFVKRQAEDPSGFQTLQKVLGETDMDEFKGRWEKYVLNLRQGYEVTVQ